MTLSAEEIDQLVTKNVKLAYGLAGSFSRSYRVEEEEATNVALAALVKAANAFDPEIGSNFASLAGRYIRNSLRHMVKMPQGKVMLRKVELDAPVGDEEGTESTGHEIIGVGGGEGAIGAERVGMSDLLQRELQGVAPGRREWVERWINGGTYREIADELTRAGHPVSFVTVGKVIQRELEKMRERLAQKGITGVSSFELEGLTWLSQDMNISEKELSYQARKKLPKGEFVFPKERKYPIHDKPHARNALARVSAHGTSSEKAEVKAAVHRKFPEIGKMKESIKLFARRFLSRLLEEGLEDDHAHGYAQISQGSYSLDALVLAVGWMVNYQGEFMPVRSEDVVRMLQDFEEEEGEGIEAVWDDLQNHLTELPEELVMRLKALIEPMFHFVVPSLQWHEKITT